MIFEISMLTLISLHFIFAMIVISHVIYNLFKNNLQKIKNIRIQFVSIIFLKGKNL